MTTKKSVGLALTLGLLALALQLIVSAAYRQTWMPWEPTSLSSWVALLLLASAVALLIKAFRHR